MRIKNFKKVLANILLKNYIQTYVFWNQQKYKLFKIIRNNIVLKIEIKYD